MVPLREIREEGGRGGGESPKAFLALFGLQGLILEGQEEQGTLKQLEGVPPSSFTSLWFCSPSFWLFAGLPGIPCSEILSRR